MLRINQIKLLADEPVSELGNRIAAKLKINASEIKSWKIFRESIDARNKNNIHFKYTVDFSLANEKAENRILKKMERVKSVQLSAAPDSGYVPVLSGYEGRLDYDGERPVIAGFGPCGMFAALILAEAGLRPIVIERGRRVSERAEDVERFWETGELDENSNVQFGEGGAGTFSDGKLTTGTKDKRISKVLDELIEAGAQPEISYKHMPHIGTDVLREVVRNIREKIIRLGGEVQFGRQLTGLSVGNGRLSGIAVKETYPDDPADADDMYASQCADGNVMNCGCLVLAPGNAARDTFEMLYDAGISMEAKPFSVGVRIEHPQVMIDMAQYGEADDTEGRLSAAVYKLSYHCRDDGRGVYTFCMCPGGYVVGAASENGGVVTNGMSYAARDGENANSALLVSVYPEDCFRETGEDHPLAGMRLQRKLERKAYEAGGGGFAAPVQTLGEFMGRGPEDHAYTITEPTYRPAVRRADIAQCLPEFATASLKEAVPEMARRLKGFDMSGAVITGVETRSSSPVRILRNKEYESVSVSGMYPGGEGAGYAGGIVSSAVDGVRIAEKIIEKMRGKN